MKALCIIGSPREQGCTAHVVEAIAQGMTDTGIEVKTTFLPYKKVHYFSILS